MLNNNVWNSLVQRRKLKNLYESISEILKFDSIYKTLIKTNLLVYYWVQQFYTKGTYNESQTK